MTITYDDFKKVDLKVVTIVEAERVPNSDKLLRLLVNEGAAERQIVAGIGKAYEPESLIGKQIVVVNLEPRDLMGLTSEGMILAAHGDTPVVLIPEKSVPAGSDIS